MKAEKFILSVIAILIGLLAAGGIFYVYQMMRVVPNKTKTIAMKHVIPTPTPDLNNFLTVDNPADESVTSSKTLSISGKTVSSATVLVDSDSNDEVATPASNGNFTLTIPLDDGTSLIHITAIFKNGDEKQITRTVTFSSESF